MKLGKFINREFIILLILSIFLLPQNIFAWGANGHRIIGEIAENIMQEKTKKKVHNILSNASIPMVANWGDFIKSDPKYDKYSSWHYTDLDPNMDRKMLDSAAVTTEYGECVFRVIQLAEHLKQNPNDTNMLKMLIHIVGDMYQPLHIGHKDDVGGNKVKINWFKQSTNIHSLWDEKLIDYHNLSYTEFSKHLLNVYGPKKVQYSKQFVLDEVWNTYLVTAKIYADLPSEKNYENSYLYVYNYASVLENQLVRAGIMLATILEYIYA